MIYFAPRLFFVFLILSEIPVLVAAAEQSLLDRLDFGVPASENAHGAKGEKTETIVGPEGRAARRLLPRGGKSWDGGSIAFTMKVDPARQNYFTIQLWGSDTGENRLILFCEGKQIGYRHLGDIDLLDISDEEPFSNDRFFFNTTPLPRALTEGKTELHCEIRSLGPTWGYGETFERYQKPMTEPSRGVYSVYTHTDGYFTPPAELKLAPGAPATVRTSPGPEVLQQATQRVNSEVTKLLNARSPLNQMQLLFLARAFFVKDTPAFQEKAAVAKVVFALDNVFLAFRKNPKLAEADPVTPNPDWFGLGPSGAAVSLLDDYLKSEILDQPIVDEAGHKIPRRAAWSEMLQASRDWHLRHRRQYTNQTMIVDLNIYHANRGIAAIDTAHARPEAEMLGLLYEAVGLHPWLGSETANGPEKPLGDHYYQLTAKGLTKELGFVGYYGEVLDWVTEIYDATRPSPGQPGDEKIKAQLARIIHARAVFRYPAEDAKGFRAMRIETVVGWRDTHFPGNVTYAERPTWDASPLFALAATLDRDAIGYGQQMIADNQFFASLKSQMQQNESLRVTAGLLEVPADYATITQQPPSLHRLPMAPGEPDFVFSDEEDGVVAIKHGETILYASLYWRARTGINFLARIHEITPVCQRIAVVREDIEFEPSGQNYARPDWINFGFAKGGPRYPQNLHSAHTGELLPIAKIPEGVKFSPGDENIYAGRGSFYTLRYGPFLIAMNMSAERTYPLRWPEGAGALPELVSGKSVSPEPRGELSVGPKSTVVLWVGESSK